MSKKETKKRSVRVGDVVAVYNALKKQNILKLSKEDKFYVLRVSRILREVAVKFEEFAKDAQERLKPENFDDIMAKGQKFSELTEDERREVNATVEAYQRSVDECLAPELERECELGGYEAISDDAKEAFANEGVNVGTLLMIEDVCG